MKLIDILFLYLIVVVFYFNNYYCVALSEGQVKITHGAADRRYGYYGYSVAISSDSNYCIIRGSTNTDPPYPTVYIFKKSSNDQWIFQYNTPMMTALQSCCCYYHCNGDSVVDIDGEGTYAVEGVPKTHQKVAGIVHVYKRTSGWTLFQSLSASDGYGDNYGDYFGTSVAISDNGLYLIVLAQRAVNKFGVYKGAAYIFTRINSTFVEQQKLEVHASVNGRGASISADGKYAIFGAGSSVYIFIRTGTSWTHLQTINSPDGISNFGYYCIRISGDANYIAVGTGSNSVFIYKKVDSNFIYEDKLNKTGGSFGYKVDINYDGTNVLVGGISTNAAYMYTRDHFGGTWRQLQILPFDGASGFGFSVSISGNGRYTLIGSPTDSTVDYNVGSAYVQKVPCLKGYRLDNNNCIECENGTYANVYFASECFPCPVGTYCPNKRTIYPTTCTSGTFSKSNGRSKDCEFCPAGSYCPTTTDKHLCRIGRWCQQGSTNDSTLCPEGHYCLEGSQMPIKCSNGTYCPSKGRTRDGDPCNAGYFCPTTELQLNCEAGYYCPMGSTKPFKCSIGTYCPTANRAGDGDPCPVRNYCPNSTSQLKCPMGTYCPTRSVIPSPCPPQHYCQQGDAVLCSTTCPSNLPILVSPCSITSDITCSSGNIVQSFDVPWVLIIIFITAGTVATIVARLITKKYPYSKPWILFGFIFAIVDLSSDLAFIVHVKAEVTWAFHAALAIFIVSLIFQSIYCTILMHDWLNFNSFHAFLLDRPFWVSTVWFVASTNIESILVINCKVFNLDMFSAVISKRDQHRISRVGIIGLLLESISQFIVQVLVGLQKKEISGVVGFALIVSLSQLIILLAKYSLLFMSHRKRKNGEGIELQMEEAADDKLNQIIADANKYGSKHFVNSLDETDAKSLLTAFIERDIEHINMSTNNIENDKSVTHDPNVILKSFNEDDKDAPLLQYQYDSNEINH